MGEVELRIDTSHLSMTNIIEDLFGFQLVLFELKVGECLF